MKNIVGLGLVGILNCIVIAPMAQAADLPTKTAPIAIDVAPVPFFLFQDNQISYRYAPNAREPGVLVPNAPSALGPAQNIEKNIFGLTHVDAYQYGTNFFNVDFLSSNAADPAAPAITPFTGGGALEIYALYRGTLSGNALTHSKMFSYGFVKDVSLGFGGDINTKDTFFGPRKRDVVGGVQLAFDVRAS